MLLLGLPATNGERFLVIRYRSSKASKSRMKTRDSLSAGTVGSKL